MKTFSGRYHYLFTRMEFFVPAKGDGAELRTAFLNEKKDLWWLLLGSFSG